MQATLWSCWSKDGIDGLYHRGQMSTKKALPPDTKLLLTKNYSEVIIFAKITNSTSNPRKCPYFLEILRVQNASNITKNNSQGIIFVIISCQRLQNNCFGTINFVIVTKRTLYKANSFACSLAKQVQTCGSNIAKKMLWWNYFCVAITKIITKENVPRNGFVIISARMVCIVRGSRSQIATVRLKVDKGPQYQKNPRAHKNNICTFPPSQKNEPPLLRRGTFVHGVFQQKEPTNPRRPLSFGNGLNTVSESTAPNTTLSEVFGSPSSRERAQ